MVSEMELCNDSDSESDTSSSEWSLDEDNPKKRYKCSYDDCGKSFFRPSKLKNHLRIHTGEKPFKCDISNCGTSFHRNELLKKHQQQVHFKNIKYVVCKEEGCGKKLTQNSLQKHMLRKHNSFRRWKFHCEQCNKGFHNKNILAKHINEHKTVLRCEICGKEFERASLLTRHTNSHKEYQCLCTAKFFCHNLFRTHKKDCEFTKPMCNICNKQFAKIGNLKEHVNIVHGRGDQIFKCTFEECTRQYNRKSNLKLHIADSHTEKEDVRFVCSVCSEVIKTKYKLWIHMKHAHINENKKIKKPRRPRKDKNIPKKPLLSVLTGIKPDRLVRKVEETNPSESAGNTEPKPKESVEKPN